MVSIRVRLALSLLVSLSLVACGGDESRPKAAPGSGGSGATGGGGGSGGGATGGAGGSAGSSGGAGGVAGSSGAGGVAGSAGAAGAPPVVPIDVACSGALAFRATGAAFVQPTPKDLAKELSALTYDYGEHPLTIVLLAKPGGQVTVSATETQSGGFNQVFPSGKKPDFVGLVLKQGGFASKDEIPKAWLQLEDQNGTVYVELTKVTVSASTASNCQSLVATVDAFIPSSQGSVSLALASGATTIATLAGPLGGGGQGSAEGWQLRMLFPAQATDFDFGSL